MKYRGKPGTRVICLLLGSGIAGAFAWQLAQPPADKYIAAMDNPHRVLKVDEVIAKLELKPGMIVADIGSGSGSFSIPMAKAIAPNGILYAVDIDQAMLDHVAARAKEAGVSNVRTVLGEFDDPKLPVKNADVAFFHRVLHMIEHRQAYLNATARYLAPDGRVVVIEKNREDSPDWMWLNQPDVDSWMAAIGFYPAQHFGVFDDRYFVAYQRPYGKSVLLKKGPAKKD
ncbi:MAG: Ubiquinone/menaquinone biosynthesis C-methyltransferase UbiE [Bryobacteraceae bacterium]|nr:Ubiquinone/menaquinone biosynthesis C-methyltransferase UbiE [Bryobacteraceae bacterium]